jgi:uncharacterized protein YcnI
MRRHIRPLVSAILAAGLVLVLAGPAWAHVTVNPNTAAQGGYAKLAFRVPNEKDNADTTQLDIQIPTDHPIASVSVQPQPGWSYKVTKSKLATPIKTDDGEVTDAVSQITWTGGTIKPGEFNEFNISAGPLPNGITSIQFKALQTYSDGDVVRWIEDTKAGQPMPQHPAPMLTLSAAASDTAAAVAAPASTKSSDGTARTLGIIGVIVGVLGLVAGGFALMSRRGSGDRPSSGSTPAGRQTQQTESVTSR